MANTREYREGDTIDIEWCKYEVRDYYLSAKWNGSYPKVLAKILWISNLNKFVEDTLGYNRYDWKILWFDWMEDCNKLINALQKFKGVAPTKSGALQEAAIKKFFETDKNLTRLEWLSEKISTVLGNFNTIKGMAHNVITKVASKNDEFVNAIDTQNVKAIERIEKEFDSIIELITKSEEVLASLNKVGAANSETETDFDAAEFINPTK